MAAAKVPSLAGLSQEQIEHYREAYSIFDKDNDGAVSLEELSHVLRCLGMNASDTEARRLFLEIDEDHSGKIDFKEFLVLMQTIGGGPSSGETNTFTNDDWAHAFKIFDLNGDGYITAQELGQVLENMGQGLKDFELEEMIQEVSSDASGRVSLEDFIHVMTHGIQVD
eukprot:CAMPEP_0202049240 /NCGR_PEP_ID=MMETSP0963-20130614/3254_1 /ASSEMBLY_ACC=CAM_ASM_000494 /TAXON_ID=4773 /ORGANISM="Schizochytrium aggregatum, Strain ATCC28209" /LENGTH=167 /DNA_ID=CAMNT_0048614233 /DNA_START=180 /DNA_END=683 /DNA_ORIENTATION=-